MGANMRTFENTRKALEFYDSRKAARDALWNSIESEADVRDCEALEKEHLRQVQEAFHKDTSDINSLENCYRVDVGFMRRMAMRQGENGE